MKKQFNQKGTRGRFNLRLVTTLSASIIGFLALFRLLKNLNLYLFAVILYSVITLSVALWYIIYNKGVISGTVSPDMLPAEWSAEQKQSMIDDIAARHKKSKWVFLIVVPMIFVFAFELLELYFFPLILSLFSGN